METVVISFRYSTPTQRFSRSTETSTSIGRYCPIYRPTSIAKDSKKSLKAQPIRKGYRSRCSADWFVPCCTTFCQTYAISPSSLPANSRKHHTCSTWSVEDKYETTLNENHRVYESRSHDDFKTHTLKTFWTFEIRIEQNGIFNFDSNLSWRVGSESFDKTVKETLITMRNRWWRLVFPNHNFSMNVSSFPQNLERQLPTDSCTGLEF